MIKLFIYQQKFLQKIPPKIQNLFHEIHKLNQLPSLIFLQEIKNNLFEVFS